MPILRSRSRPPVPDAPAGPVVPAAGPAVAAERPRRPTRRTDSRELEAVATRAGALTVASRQASDGFGQVAGAVEELRSSIADISASTSRASLVAADAVEHAREVTGRVAELQHTSQEIGEIVGAITSITQQSRMLALNATIEAARAGEAGRGFAVVAHEVKELAGKTAAAAERIARQIATVQTQTAAAAEGVCRITTTIDVIHEAQGSIAAAVEQQSAAAGSIVASVAVASAGSDRLAGALAEEQRLSFVAAALAVASDLLHERGVTLGSPEVRWTAVSQIDGTRREVLLPRLLVGGVWTGQNDDPRVPTAFVDDVHGLVGGPATLFQRTGPEGDMLRTATDVLTPAGRRNIGTCIPARGPDGTRSPVLAEVLAGRTYTGDAVVAGRPFTAAYEPVLDERGEVIGMLFVGLPKTAEA